MQSTQLLFLDAGRRCVARSLTDKLGAPAPHAVAPLAALDTLVVEHDADPAALAPLQAAGAPLHRAGPPLNSEAP